MASAWSNGILVRPVDVAAGAAVAHQGVVVAVGDELRLVGGAGEPITIRVGDRVLFGDTGIGEVDYGGEALTLLGPQATIGLVAEVIWADTDAASVIDDIGPAGGAAITATIAGGSLPGRPVIGARPPRGASGAPGSSGNQGQAGQGQSAQGQAGSGATRQSSAE